jgi:hypothetical protein
MHRRFHSASINRKVSVPKIRTQLFSVKGVKEILFPGFGLISQETEYWQALRWQGFAGSGQFARHF